MNNENLFSDFPAATAAQWKELIKQELRGKEYESIVWKTFDGLKFNPFYTKEDIETLEQKNTIPGHCPYLRGNKVDGNYWEIRQNITVSDAKEANKKALEILNKGVTSLGFITPTNEVSNLLKDVLIEHVSVNFSTKHPLFLLENLITEIKQRNLSSTAIKGSVDYDFLGEMLLTGKCAGTKEGFDIAAEIVQILSKEKLSFFRGINVSGNNYHNAGASIVQELAFSLSHANEYLVELCKKNLSTDAISDCMQFTFSTGSSYLMEIAKLRAARMLWAKIIEQYKPHSDSSFATFIHCQTSAWSLSIADSHNNLLRATTQTMSSAIGGADSIEVLPFDCAYRPADEFSERIARNIQIVCAEEAHLNKVVDPSGGSYYIERLTDSIAAATWELFKQTELKGGFLEAIKTGFIQDEIQKTAHAKNDSIAKGEMVMVGVNKYINKTEQISQKEAFVKSEYPLGQTDIRPLKIYRAAMHADSELVKQKTEL
ncbi:MAG: acyl-CoA mutase large subunit family protein [Bacteroidetes bacterium]|nr:acyl-CoA mutase large subunit family protein [Bacteroidota bacterium]HET6243636.1 acyl-CoA mutase large subunit family protein [Bacteroidia bacterium]